jgi:hypothetical protein
MAIAPLTVQFMLACLSLVPITNFAAGFHDPGGGALTLFVNPEVSRPAPWPDSPQASSWPRLTASASVQSTRRYRNQGIGRALPTNLILLRASAAPQTAFFPPRKAKNTHGHGRNIRVSN